MTSVADPGCLSRILIFIYPVSRIQQQHQKRRGKFFLSYHFCSHKYHKNCELFSFEPVKKIYFLPIFVIELPKIWVWDPGSGIRKKTYCGSRIQGQKGTGSRIRNTENDRSSHRVLYKVHTSSIHTALCNRFGTFLKS